MSVITDSCRERERRGSHQSTGTRLQIQNALNQTKDSRPHLSRQETVGLHSTASSSGDVETGLSLADKPREVYHRNLWDKFRKLLRKASKALGLKHLIPFLLVIIYTFIGGLIFLAVEGPNDVQERSDQWTNITAERRHVVKRIATEIFVDANYTPARREEEVSKAIERYEFIMESVIGCSFSNETVWNFWSAMYFSGTIYTTIGYGNIACQTAGGQILTIIYALIGIPLVLTSLNDLGTWLFNAIQDALTSARRMYRWLIKHPAFKRKKLHLYQEHHDDIKVEYEQMDAEKPVRNGGSVDIKFSDSELPPDSSVEEQKFKIPVSVALIVTIGWILFCSALFCVWETNWTIGTSIYFFFISLSTIGLGDVVPEHPKFMILMFPLVLVGLSLVSMCINVVQQKLEDLFMQLLLKILVEYQRRLSEGQDQMGATMGMMHAWNSSPAAKYLMPLLSKDKKSSVMQQLQEEAKAQGIQLPAVLLDVNADTGLPNVLQVTNTLDYEPPLPADLALLKHIEDSIQKADEVVQQHMQPAALLPPVPCVETAVVTEPVPETPKMTSETACQYEQLELINAALQTLSSTVEQCVGPDSDHRVCENATQTQSSIATQTEAALQTETPSQEDGSAQTQNSLFAIAHKDNQTDLAQFTPTETQTEIATGEVLTQTSISFYHSTTRDCQTMAPQLSDNVAQTQTARVLDSTSQTTAKQCTEQTVQTFTAQAIDHANQTESLLQAAHAEIQTGPLELEIQEVQTDGYITVEQETQTHEDHRTMSLSVPLSKSGSSSSLAQLGNKASAKIKQAFGGKKKEKAAAPKTLQEKLSVKRAKSLFQQATEELPDEPGSDTEIEPDETSESEKESLAWDPIDGMHAEKQRPVSALKQMFEVAKPPTTAAADKGKAKQPPPSTQRSKFK